MGALVDFHMMEEKTIAVEVVVVEEDLQEFVIRFREVLVTEEMPVDSRILLMIFLAMRALEDSEAVHRAVVEVVFVMRSKGVNVIEVIVVDIVTVKSVVCLGVGMPQEIMEQVG